MGVRFAYLLTVPSSVVLNVTSTTPLNYVLGSATNPSALLTVVVTLLLATLCDVLVPHFRF